MRFMLTLTSVRQESIKKTMNQKFELNNLIRNNIKAMKPYSSARDEFKEFSSDLVFLDANENPFDNGVNRYPDPQQLLLKQKLSELKNISTDNILLGNGSDEVLDLIFRAFCEPKEDEIIIMPPTYGMYEVLANLNDILIRSIWLNEDFQFNVNRVVGYTSKKTKLIFICSPNNPTGNTINIKNIERLLKKTNTIVVIDEAYIDFSNQESWLSRLEEFPNLIVTQTLSKAFGMAGIRLGVCYASADIISVLNKIKPPYNINELTQQRALEGLINQYQTTRQINLLISERILLANELAEINWIEKVYPSDANFLLVKVDDANKRYQELIAKGIVVRNRTNQPLCENCLRFTIGTQIENKRLIDKLKNI